MPKFPGYERQIAAPGPHDKPIARAGDYRDGSGLAALGTAVTNAGSTLAQFALDKQKYESQKIANQAHADWSERLEKMKQDAPLGADGFTDSVKTQFDSWKEQTLSTAPGGAAGRALQNALINLKANLTHSALQFEKTSQAKKQVADLEEGFSKNDNLVFAHPDQLQETISMEKNLIEASPFWDKQLKGKVSNDRRLSLYDKALEGLVRIYETDPVMTPDLIDNFIKELRDEKAQWIANTTPRVYQNAIIRLERDKKSLSSVNEKQLLDDFNEEMARWESTGVRPNKYPEGWEVKGLSSPAQREHVRARMVQAKARAEAVNLVRYNPASVVVQDINKLDQDYKNPELTPAPIRYKKKMAIEEFAKRTEFFLKDPVGYSMSVFPELRAVHDEMVRAPTPEKVSLYADMVSEKQTYLYPEVYPRLLDQSDIDSVKTRIDMVDKTPNGAQAVTQLLQEERAKWGKYWPRALIDLKRKNVINDGQYIAATMFDNPAERLTAEDIVKSSIVKTETVKALVPDSKKTKEAIRENVRSALSDFKQSLKGFVDDLGVYAPYENALVDYLMYLKAKDDPNADGKDKAKDIANRVVLNKYTFQDGYRIPKDQDASSISNGAKSWRNYITNYDLVLPSSLNPHERTADAKRKYMNRVLDGGTLVTSADDTGLRLLDPKGIPVWMYKDGKEVPVFWSWSDLRQMSIEKAITEERLRHKPLKEKQ